MEKYELAVVISSKVEENVRSETLAKCKALIERFGGQIGHVEDWGRKRLAYEIDRMNEAYYYFVKFEAEPTAPAEIESRMRVMDNVIRYLLVKDDGYVQQQPAQPQDRSDVQPEAEQATTERVDETNE